MAAPSLEPEDMLVLRVPGLTDSTEPSAFGYLLVTRTRAGNRRSASWIAMHVILPFIESLRNAVSESMSDEERETGDLSSVFTLDGEKIGIDAWNDAEGEIFILSIIISISF